MAVERARTMQAKAILFGFNYLKKHASAYMFAKENGNFADAYRTFIIMKRLFLFAAMAVFGLTTAFAQSAKGKKQAEIKFEKTTHDFGDFSESAPKLTYTFNYTNVGDAPLIINQATASCGCTVPEYTKAPVQPGGKGQVKVTYNGEGRFPGHFKKTITLRTNGKVEMTRLYIQGNMLEEER